MTIFEAFFNIGYRFLFFELGFLGLVRFMQD
jgi:hypothetical protein